MKLIQFAVASIVDANTGYGYAGAAGKIDYAAAERHSRKIRSRSITDLLALFAQRIAARIDQLKAARERRRELKTLQGLNDHLLRDIGLSRADLLSVELGHTSLATLDAERQARHLHAQTASQAKIGTDGAAEAANHEAYAESKCA